MDEQSDLWDHRYYKITKRLLRILGHWPYQSRRETLTCRATVIFLLIIHVTPQILAAIHSGDYADIGVEITSCFIVDACAIASISTLHIHYAKMKVLLDQIQVDWTIFPANNGRHMLHKSMVVARQFGILHAGTLFSAAVIFVTEPIQPRIFRLFVPSNETLTLRFAIPVYYGIFDTEKYYWYIFLATGFCIFLLVTAIVALDALLFVYAQHFRGLLGALGFAIENLPVNETSSEYDDDYAYDYVKKCVLIHHRAIEFANSVEDIFTWNFFTMLGLNMLGISLTAVQAATHHDEMETLVKASLFSLSEILHLFVQCYMAQRIVDTSLLMQHNLMNARWYESTPRIKQSLQFMMMRSQIPCQLTAGRMLPFSLNLFSTVIRTSATYFTLFMDMQ